MEKKPEMQTLTTHHNTQYQNHEGENHMLTTTSNVVPTIADGGYYGYGRTGELLDKIAFDQNQQIQRDVLKNNSDIKQSEIGLMGNIQSTACNLNSNNIMRSLETNMMLSNQFAGVQASMNSQFNRIDNKIDMLERDLLSQKIADLRDDKILAGQANQRLQSEVNAFCCPKPAAIYQPLQCPTAANGAGSNVNVNEVVNIVNTMLASRGNG